MEKDRMRKQQGTDDQTLTMDVSIGQSQSIQGAGNMLLVWLVLDSPLSQCQRSTQETDCPRL